MRESLLFLLISAVILVAGCMHSPPNNFYKLAPVAKASERCSISGTLPPVAFASVTIPDLVDRPQLVLPDNGTQVRILETSRWAEPLKSTLPRLLAENLSRYLCSDNISAYPQHASIKADCRIFVDFHCFESTGKAVVVDASWSIRSNHNESMISGRTKITEAIEEIGIDGLVSAYSRSVAIVAIEIGKKILELKTEDIEGGEKAN